jgi:hypothetical protein
VGQRKALFSHPGAPKKTSLLESFSTRVSVVDQEMRGSTVHFLARLKTQADIPLNIG